jgi:hypothetical protein
MRRLKSIAAPLAVLLACLASSGCAAIAFGTAGGLIVDEGIVENDGKFDPLEETRVGRAFDELIN